MPEKFWTFKNETEETADLYIYDEIGDGYFGESVSAKSFKKELNALGDIKELNIYINSPGGSVFDGMAIYSQLKRHKARKTVYVDGLAASIASVIALAGNKLVIPSNGYFMIHKPWSMMWGDAEEFRKMANSLDTIEEGIVNVYDENSFLTIDELKEMMANETWMTGKEAVEHGFADEVSEEINIAASVTNTEVWDKYKNAPKIEKPKKSVNNGRVPVEIINKIYERSIKNA